MSTGIAGRYQEGLASRVEQNRPQIDHGEIELEIGVKTVDMTVELDISPSYDPEFGAPYTVGRKEIPQTDMSIPSWGSAKVGYSYGIKDPFGPRANTGLLGTELHVSGWNQSLVNQAHSQVVTAIAVATLAPLVIGEGVGAGVVYLGSPAGKAVAFRVLTVMAEIQGTPGIGAPSSILKSAAMADAVMGSSVVPRVVAPAVGAVLVVE
ncbi:hypothetical protein [uncultured Microbulbifer sp.]|uniref:hypothetical protein n=1 Tax=uncultured Microbulbifer sp. TaxID=348147 RepID=UPI002639ACB3|nr:hypothetical protein [uncultured Microbulbifer sp.]